MKENNLNVVISGTLDTPYFSLYSENNHIGVRVGVEWEQILAEALKRIAFKADTNYIVEKSEFNLMRQIYEKSKKIFEK